MIVSSCYFLQHTYKHISKTLNVTVSKVLSEIPQPEKVFKDTQNRDDPGIMAWDHYSFTSTLTSFDWSKLALIQRLY
jgi:hypothetical protein